MSTASNKLIWSLFSSIALSVTDVLSRSFRLSSGPSKFERHLREPRHQTGFGATFGSLHLPAVSPYLKAFIEPGMMLFTADPFVHSLVDGYCVKSLFFLITDHLPPAAY
ncbi:hypothetical protein CPB83DRAFT_895921 [Crepidotus variabilis]|uniref:Uncharacterized protein n=1 Tax=Crepidotus variabilis TaxID=179855 RepID=A0A9P6EC77_9AGAR|nr:hypothetical protein CPB83DRAFT_895921 [Crepidotus variabilis]